MQNLAIIKDTEFMTTPVRALADELLAEGKLTEARGVIEDAVNGLDQNDVDEMVALRCQLAKVERAAGNLYEALSIHRETYPLAQLSRFPIVKWSFHNGLGITYDLIAIKEGQREYRGKALIEYEAARFHAEDAGERNLAGYIENNIALIHCDLGETGQAHEHLERARTYFTDPVKLAQIDETEARVYLKEEKPDEALTFALDACQTFKRFNEKRLLDDALPTLMKAIADYRVK